MYYLEMAIMFVGWVFLMVSRMTVDSEVVSVTDTSTRMGSIKVNAMLPVGACVCVRKSEEVALA